MGNFHLKVEITFTSEFLPIFYKIISIFIADMVKWLWLLKGENSLDEKDKDYM